MEQLQEFDPKTLIDKGCYTILWDLGYRPFFVEIFQEEEDAIPKMIAVCNRDGNWKFDPHRLGLKKPSERFGTMGVLWNYDIWGSEISEVLEDRPHDFHFKTLFQGILMLPKIMVYADQCASNPHDERCGVHTPFFNIFPDDEDFEAMSYNTSDHPMSDWLRHRD